MSDSQFRDTTSDCRGCRFLFCSQLRAVFFYSPRSCLLPDQKIPREKHTRTVHEIMEGGELERDEQGKVVFVHLFFGARNGSTRAQTLKVQLYNYSYQH